MMVVRKLRHDEAGASVVEFAIALPILVSFIWGIFQCGLLFQANAGMQHALGEAARMATLFPYPGDDAVKAKVVARKFGTYNGSLAALTITDNNVTTGSGATAVTTTVSKDLRLQYTHNVRFLFVPAWSITLVKTKRVYLSS